MAIEIQAPQDFSAHINEKTVTIFTGGSIEMNTATLWQRRVVNAFKDNKDVVILNPRRDNWDSSWKQVKTDKQFRQQVEWELSALEQCSVALMFFDPATKSPISLLETGLFAYDMASGEMGFPKLLVICPKGFWRKGNVDIVCERYDIPQFTNLKAAIEFIKTNLDHYKYERW